MAAVSIAFEAPDNYRGFVPSNKRPIDLVHLARQTSGDKLLELEVLQAFARQARSSMNELASGDAGRIREIAHRLKGAALAVGAFCVSEAAEKIESGETGAAEIALLGAAVVDVENFILKLSR